MKNWDIGVLAPLLGKGPSLEKVSELGLACCQLVNWDQTLWSETLARKVREEAKTRGIRISALWAGVPGPHQWDFLQGPDLLGLVPGRYRRSRVAALKKAGLFARFLGVEAVITHLGFIPENLTDPLFTKVVEATRTVADALNELGLEFWFETGQETPVTLLRLMQSVDRNNLGINLDPANLLMYGKANACDSVAQFGSAIRNVHAKDGCYPTDPRQLGEERKLGQGQVNYPRFLECLKEAGYEGPFIIEREISGPDQDRDIKEAVTFLRNRFEDLS